MLNIKGILNKNGEIVFPHGKSLHLKTLYQEQTPQLPIEINIELSISIDFIQNDVSGLRLKPEWSYPACKRNQSFVQWINE